MLKETAIGAHVAAEIHHFVDGDRAAEAFHGDLALVAAHDAVLDQREGFVGDQDFTGFSQGFQAAGQVHFLADDGVVHAVLGAEVANGGVACADAHADFQRCLDTLAAPFLPHDFHVFTHFHRHGHAGEGVFFLAPAGGVTEENHDGIANELIDGAAVFEGHFRHFVEVVVQQFRQCFRLHLFGQFCKTLDVGEEDGQFLALCFQPHVPFTGKDGLPHLR